MSPHERTTYLASIERSEARNVHERTLYSLANMAISEARGMTMRAQEPTETMLDNIAYRLDCASISNEQKDMLASKRALVLKAYLEPLVWSDLLNIDGLGTAQSKRVSSRIGLREANDTVARLAGNTLEVAYSIIRHKHVSSLPKDQYEHYAQIRGFLEETTVLLLANRGDTAKLLALPSLEYEDAMIEPKSRRADGILYDNRKVASAISRQFPYQVKSQDRYFGNDYTIPVIDGQLLGNNARSELWQSHLQPFATLEYLIAERQGKCLPAEVTSNLDRIWGKVRNHIMSPVTKPIVIPKPTGPRQSGDSLIVTTPLVDQ